MLSTAYCVLKMRVELKHINKRFGAVHANNDITLTFEAGRIIGVLGENGAGKSTLMKILSGYQRADSGEIWLDGQRTAFFGTLAAIQHGVGMLQQDPLDIGAFTVLENFVYGGPKISRSAARAKLNELCQNFGFTLNPDTPCAQLSIAQRQQLEIVRLLALGVRLLILDEPTTGISAEQKTLLFDALRQLARQQGMTILLVSHKLEDVIALCDEIVVLRAGRLVGDLTMPATPAQIVELMFGTKMAEPKRKQQHIDHERAALTLENVTLSGGRVTVEGFTLRLHPGEVVGLAGLEGSGQELVLRAGAGLAHLLWGAVRVGDTAMNGQPYREFMKRGVVFAAAGRLEEGLVAGLTLTDHVALASEHGLMIDWKRARQRAEAQIKRFQVRGTPDSRIETLSGGNQQRMLMGLMPENPTALILEQPTRGLDVESARWIWEQLLDKRANGAAILFSSPELDEILAYADRIIVFFAGRAHEIANPESLTLEQLGYLIGGKMEL